MTTLLTLHIHSKRDLLLARRRTRRLAALLGFDYLEQATMSAAVFELVRSARRRHNPVTLRYCMEQDTLQIDTGLEDEVGLANRIVKVLPKRTMALAIEDMMWVTKELEKHASDHLFAEIALQNQELLRVIRELQICQARLAQLNNEWSRPTAA